MVLNYSKVFIDQIKPDSHDVGVIDSDFNWSGQTDVREDSIKYGTYNSIHYPLARNPKPVNSCENYFTANKDDWSDSPLLNPTLSDSKRYSYGRNGFVRYGKLDNYSGLVIKQILAGTDGDYNIYDDNISSSVNEECLDKYITGSTLMEETERVSNDVFVYQYNFVVFSRPKAFSYKNPIDTDVSIRLANYVFPLSSGTVTLSLEGENKTGLEVIPFYTGLGGFDAKWYNNEVFDYDQQVEVVWTVYDTAIPSNLLTIRYWFKTVKDLTGPRISNVSPADDSVDNAVSTCISFDIEDFELGVNINSLELYVNNVEVSHSDLTITLLDNENGYHVSYCTENDFLYGDVIPVSIYVEDSSEDKNNIFFVFSFTTKESDKPLFIDATPDEFLENVSITTDISVVVSDGGAGIDKENTSLTVDGVEQVDQQMLPIVYRQV